jgi:hypothetical protein
MFKLHDGAQVSTIYLKLSATNPQKRLGWSCFGKSSIPNAFLGLSIILGNDLLYNFFKKGFRCNGANDSNTFQCWVPLDFSFYPLYSHI